MGFFDTFKRMVEGKPLFETPEPEGRHVNRPQPQQPSAQPGQPQPVQQPIGPKEIPGIDIRRTESRNNGPNMLVTCNIKNESKSSLDLDKLRMLGRVTDLGTILRPGQERQVNIYDGPRPRSMNDRAVVLGYRKTEDTDYFQAEFNIEYEHEEDGTYVIEKIELLRTHDV